MYRPNPHPLGGWETIRHAYPLVPKAIGLVNGEVWIARANWDRVEVRDERGVVRFEHTIPRAMAEGLLDSMSLVDAHLACAISTGLAPYGLRVWDLRTEEIVIDLATREVDGPYLLSSPPASSLVVVGDPECVAVWDVRRRTRLRTLALAYALSGVLDPGSGRLACGDDHHVHVHDATGARIASWSVEGGDLETVAWGASGRFLVGTTVRANAQVWDAEDGSLLDTLDARGDILGASPCGRWLALEDAIVDLEDLSARAVAASAAVFDTAAQTFVLADADHVWRVRV